MAEKKAMYFQLGIILLRDLRNNKVKCLNNILDYGVYRYAEGMKIDRQKMIRQTIYELYAKKLPDSIDWQLNIYIDRGQLTHDEHYKGFGCDGYDPETETEELDNILKNDLDLDSEIEHWYRCRQTCEFYGIKGDMLSAYERGKKIAENMPDKEPTGMISKYKLFEFREKEKSAYELDVLAVVIGMGSILGKGVYFPTNKNMIFSRAYGYKDINQLRADTKVAGEFNDRWKVKDGELNEYRTNKILNDIEEGGWNLYRYSDRMRGMYIAYKNKIELENLKEVVKTKKKTVKQIAKERQQKIKEA